MASPSAVLVPTTNGHTYTYGAAGWSDLLTAYDGESITYDGNANPLSYYNGTRWTFTWENGRSLATATDGTTNISYAYDGNGLRTAKTVSGTTHYYHYASGNSYALKYNGNTYYYITNLQGDVMYLIDAQGNTVASYEYDPYGNIISTTGSMAEINPLRYRGYYYDSELEMYYLQSRYYDPQISRFINADDVSLVGASGTALGYNLFAYCENNPINNRDTTGYAVTPANVIGAIIAGVIGAVGGYFLSRWLADKLGLKGWKRTLFIGGLTSVITAAAAVIGYFIGPYVRNAWYTVKNGLLNLVRKSYKSIGSIDPSKMSNKINVAKHAWNRVLKNVTDDGITKIIHKAIKYGKWELGNNGSVYINYYIGKEMVRMSGKIINGVFRISDAWVQTK